MAVLSSCLTLRVLATEEGARGHAAAYRHDAERAAAAEEGARPGNGAAAEGEDSAPEER